MTDRELEILQKSEVYLMRYLHDFCKQNNIKYYFIGGAVLGSVRHKGFIPWDLDIDLGMPREDYNKFRELAKEKLDPKFEYHDYTNTKNFFPPHALVTIKGSSLVLTRNYLQKNDINEIFIDIFPLDTAPADEKKQKKQAKKLYSIRLLNAKKIGYVYTKSKLEVLIKKAVLLLLSPLSFKAIGKKREKIMTKYRNENSGLICSMGSQYPYTKQLMPVEMYGTPTLLEFEGEKFYGPEKAHEYLTQLYRDYMKLPPEEDRIFSLNYFKDVSVPPEIEKEL